MFGVRCFSVMKTPPFLLLAALLFWGWQSGFFLAGAIMGIVLESARFIAARWDLDDTDFNRIWSFCVLLVVVLAGYVFTTNDQGGGSNGLILRPQRRQFRRADGDAIFALAAADGVSIHRGANVQRPPVRPADCRLARAALAAAQRRPGVRGTLCQHFVSVFYHLPVFSGHSFQRGDANLFLGQRNFDRVGVVVIADAAFWSRHVAVRFRGGGGTGFSRRERHRARRRDSWKISTRNGWRAFSSKKPTRRKA